VCAGYRSSRISQKKVARAWLTDKHGVIWHVESKPKPKLEDEELWDLYRFQIRFHLATRFPDLIVTYWNTHGITKNDVFEFNVNHHYCAIRRAIRDIRRAEIIKDVPISFCIEWGLRKSELPKEWKGLPKNWTR